MYEELVKRLRDISNSDSNIKSNYIGLTMIQAADAIEELTAIAESYKRSMEAWADEAARTQPRWISVAERLPDGGSRILVCSKLRDGQYWQSVCRFANNLREVDEYDFPNERRPGFYYYDDEYGWVEKTGVTHWMPLPEPPKEETE